MSKDYIDVESKDTYRNTYNYKKPSILKRVLTVILVVVFGLSCGVLGGYTAVNFFVPKMVEEKLETLVNNGDTETGTYIPTVTVDPSGSSVAMVASVVSDTVVEIQTETITYASYFGQYVSSGAGSGVIISKDGYIVTNHHVISGATQITVRTKNGQEYPATLVGSDDRTDVAVIKIEGNDLPFATIGDSNTLVVGQEVVAIGNPLGELGGTVTNGIISALEREIEVEGQMMTLLQTNAAINPGNSGGGLFNMNGELVGVVNAKSSGEGIEGLGFAIPVNTAQKVVNDIIENGYVTGRVQLGISATSVNDLTSAYRYGVNRFGVYVNKVVVSNSPLKAGDLIVQIDDLMISSINDITDALYDKKVGDQVQVYVVRDRREQVVTVTLTEYKPQN
ncbi:MAG: trypsin-like serine protease [Erysipelotrichaceae bacterium]|nr:trypsin-like serine protease [Erysipelotrichaceae bacterium]